MKENLVRMAAEDSRPFRETVPSHSRYSASLMPAQKGAKGGRNSHGS
jgi:hypothetical protein